MKKFIARSACTAIFFLALLFNPTLGTEWYIAWETIAAVVFAIAVIFLSGRATLFVWLTVLVVTVALPFVVLGFVGEPVYGSWVASASKVIQHINLSDMIALLPTAAALIATLLYQRRMGPNNSFKPKPLRGSA